MKVVAFCGWSGAGKTTLIEALIPRLAEGGARVSVIKYAHHRVDVDQEGKDSWRHRRAGAGEVLLATDRRFALMHDYAPGEAWDVHALIARMAACDWLLLEGFKHADLPKVEVWRAEVDSPPVHTDAEVSGIVAVATDRPQALPQPTVLPLLPLGDPAAVADWLRGRAAEFAYTAPH